jgi:4-hydroxy-2-oxoheptanedioate aldolase
VSAARGPGPANRARAQLAAGGTVLSGWLTTGSTLVAETLAHAGFDALTLDLQHGAIDDGEVLGVLQAIATTDVVPLVRVAWNDPALVMKALDLGAWGVICPMIESADDVRRFVQACRYPPLGIRSFGPTRARLAHGDAYARHANDEVLAIAMIETAGALAALDEILAVPGLDAVFVGPADLSQALGGPPGSDWVDGPVPAALERVLERSAAAGVHAGLFTRSVSYARRMRERGFRLLTVGSDLDFLGGGARAAVAGVAAPEGSRT